MEALSGVITSTDVAALLCFISTRLTYGKIIKTDAVDQQQLVFLIHYQICMLAVNPLSCLETERSNQSRCCSCNLATLLAAFLFLNTLRRREHVTTWFTVRSLRQPQWVNRKVQRSSSVTRTINIKPWLGFSPHRLEAMMWCSVASLLPANKGKQSCCGSILSIFWHYVSRELLYNY